MGCCCGDHDFVQCDSYGNVAHGSCGGDFCAERSGEVSCTATVIDEGLDVEGPPSDDDE